MRKKVPIRRPRRPVRKPQGTEWRPTRRSQTPFPNNTRVRKTPFGTRKHLPEASSFEEQLVSFKRSTTIDREALAKIYRESNRPVEITGFGRFAVDRRPTSVQRLLKGNSEAERRRRAAAALEPSPFGQSQSEDVAAELISFDGKVMACPECMQTFGLQQEDLIEKVISHKSGTIRAVHIEHHDL